MSLVPGTRLGSYEILSSIAAGGMGEVYRASDTKLGRDVALKVLPEAFAQDAERMGRFEREAKVLASLNHPNIASIYGVEDSGATRALVMELVEGPSLADRISQGPIPPDEALPIAKQICEALEYAHERGIVHRDLKPANVKITPDGAVKLLDFGLAKALEGESFSGDISTSPTISRMATQAGIILGTAGYMAPEQAKGRPVDRRADIWAFGCVLCEMLTGQKTFTGETITDVLAAVVRAEPDWSALPKTTPASIQKLIRRCLTKEPRQRLRDIGDARIAIEEALSGPPEIVPGSQPAPGGQPERPRSLLPRYLPWSLAAVAILAAIVLALLRPSSPAPPLRKFEMNAGRLAAEYGAYPEVSPDGRAIAYVSGGGLFVRFLDQLEPRKLYSLTGQPPVFWSPDSVSIGFADQGKLWQIPAAGGIAKQICALPGTIISGAWGAGGHIFFSAWRGDMYEVSAQGGDAKALGLQDPKTEVDFHDLSFLPGGQELMYVVHLVGGHTRIEVLTGGKPQTVFSQSGWETWNVSYSPTGHLVFMRNESTQASIWAMSFSLSDLKPTGQPFLVADSGTLPSVSSDGTLVYVLPPPAGDGQLAWVSRAGKIEATIGKPQMSLADPALSPDGKRIAATALDAGGGGNVFVYDVDSGVGTPLLSPSSKSDSAVVGPVWTQDGKNILFTALRGINPAIMSQPSDGSGQPRELLPGLLTQLAPRGNYLMYTMEREDGTARACYAAFANGKLQSPVAKPLCLPRTSNRDADARVSPDGHYAAFAALGAGQLNVYVTQFPGGNGRWQVSTNGGADPVWSPSGNELFYLAGNELMSVKVTTHPSLSLGAPVALFSLSNANLRSGFDVSPGGQRFLMVQRVGEQPQPVLVVDQNWFAEFSGNKSN